MISYSTLLTVAFASFLLAIVPGPTVTVIIANSLRAGSRAGLLNIGGTVLGGSLLVLVLAFGLETIISVMGEAFFWIKLVGAAYLVWIGIKLLRSNGFIGDTDKVVPPKIGYFWQGFFVVITNPKALFFLGAFIPQFVRSDEGTFTQTFILGMVFVVIAASSDCIYAVLAGRAGSWLTKPKIRIAEIGSGICLIGGGVWLALSRRL